MNKNKNDYKLVFFISIVVFIVWLIVSISGFSIIQNRESLGQLGDSFGLINSLFSGLALAGIIYTIFLQTKQLKIQSKELELQREELAQTRRVLQEQQQELREQNKTQRLQRFENTLFHMISNYKDIVHGTNITLDNFDYVGKDAYRGLYKEIKDNLSNMVTGRDDLDFMKYEYKEFYNDYESYLGHYLRNVYRIFKFINDTDYIFKELKTFYADIVRAQFSNQELALIFYNSILHEEGIKNFKPLIEKYEILDNLESRILAYSTHKKHIGSKAFGET